MKQIKSRLRWIKNYVRQNPALLVLLLLSAGYFFLYYLTDPSRPAGMFGWLGIADTALYPLGWWGYYDQSQYLRMAQTLADWNLAGLSTTYSYGLGYPVVAVPAMWLGFTKDPFVFFNFATFLFAIFAAYHTAKNLISPFAGFLAGFGLAFATPLIVYTAQPWNSTVCLLVISGLLLIKTTEKINRWHFFIAGFLVAWAFAARYIDVVWFLPIAAASLYRGSFKNFLRLSIFGVIGASLWILPVLYSHNAVFGSPFKTPYVNHIGLSDSSNDQQLNAYKLSRIPDAATGMFLGPRLEGSKDTDRGMFVLMFWVLAAIPGAFIMLRKKEHRLFFGTLLVVTVLAWVFYLSFRASTPESLKYGILHYFKMFWPGLVILAVAFFDDQLQKTIQYSTNKSVKQKSKKAKI